MSTSNPLKALTLVRPNNDYRYVVVAYFLVDGDPDVVAGFNVLGAFNDIENAKIFASRVITTTEHKSVYVTRCSEWQRIGNEIQVDRTILVPIGMDNKIQEAFVRSLAQEFEREQFRLRREPRKEEEKDKRSFYIDENVSLCELWKQSEALKAKIEEKKRSISRLENENPEFVENSWLEEFEGRCIGRHERYRYEEIKKILEEVIFLNPIPVEEGKKDEDEVEVEDKDEDEVEDKDEDEVEDKDEVEPTPEGKNLIIEELVLDESPSIPDKPEEDENSENSDLEEDISPGAIEPVFGDSVGEISSRPPAPEPKAKRPETKRQQRGRRKR